MCMRYEIITIYTSRRLLVIYTSFISLELRRLKRSRDGRAAPFAKCTNYESIMCISEYISPRTHCVLNAIIINIVYLYSILPLSVHDSKKQRQSAVAV